MRNGRDAIAGADGGGEDVGSRERTAMLTVDDVAGELKCSTRTVYRLADSGRIPRPVKLGALVRWPRRVLEQWVADDCPSCAKRGASHAR